MLSTLHYNNYCESVLSLLKSFSVFVCVHLHVYMYMKKLGGPEQNGILRTAVSSLLALISAVQHNLWVYIPVVVQN